MKIRRFSVNSDFFEKDKELSFLVDADESKHMIRVLRLKRGEKIELINKKGQLALAEITDIKDDKVYARAEQILSGPKPHTEIILLQCLPKTSCFELILKKASEIGINKIRPLISRYSGNNGDGKADLEKFLSKYPRFEKIILEANKQSKSSVLTALEQPAKFQEKLNSLGTSKITPSESLYLYLDPYKKTDKSRSLESFLSPATQEIPPKEICLLIGPEGGLCDEEEKLAEQTGFLSLNLGLNILKVDTAATIASGLIKFILENKRSDLQKQ